MPAQRHNDLPDAFHALAAMCKIMAVPTMAPELHKRHYHAIELNNSIVRVLATNHPQLEAAFRKALPLPLAQGADILREVVPQLELTEEKVAWLDKQMTAALKALVAVVKDPDLPSSFSEAKWAIEQQFHSIH